MSLVQHLELGDLWWNHAIVYCLDVETFMDGDADGVGDLRGLTERVDHLAALGVNAVWLMPFFPSPGRDDGYDVADFYSVDPRLGTLGDFVTFRRTAQAHGIRVLVDLVVNHTSDEHPWFVDSASSREAKHRDWYIWTEDPNAESEEIVFPGDQTGNWTYDERTDAWYFHRFQPFQPDLNMSNPDVRQEIFRIMGFWLELGVSGFRIDAAPFLIQDVLDVRAGEPSEHHAWLKEMRSFVSRRRGDAVLFGEANLPMERVMPFFGEDDELHLLFDFIGNNATILSLVRREAEPLATFLRSLPRVPDGSAWLHFLRVHDELNLDRLTEAEQEEVFEETAPEPSMRIYDRGIRRRLASMFDGDERRLRLAFSLLFSLPGAATIYYGDEIGMGEDLSLAERLSARTPMQWTSDPNGGFSEADAERLVRPVVTGRFGPERVNAADARLREDSLFAAVRHLVEARKAATAIGLAPVEVLDAGDDRILLHRYAMDGQEVVLVHNLSADEVDVKLPDGDGHTSVVVSDEEGPGRLGGDDLRLAAYGYRWIVRTHRPFAAFL